VGYEIWSLPIRKVLKLQVSENKKLRRVFGTATDEVRIFGYYVTRVTDYGLNDAGFLCRQEQKIFLFSKRPIAALRLPQLAVPVPGDGGKAAVA
jgi:hypothetical protein